MVNFPLSRLEAQTVRWAARILPIVSGGIILLIGAISAAASGV